jgi:hypothetical protein
MTSFFVVGDYGQGYASPVHLEAYTLDQARRSKAWQARGCTHGTTYHVTKPDRATHELVDVDTGQRFKPRGDAWVAAAWAQFELIHLGLPAGALDRQIDKAERVRDADA